MDDERYFTDVGILTERNRALGLRVKELEADLTHLWEQVEKLTKERDDARVDARYHADCRPNRRQAEAAMADAKATNDRWADEVKARRELEATVTALRETLETVNAALRGVVRVADRQTIEFDAAKAAVRTVEAVLCGREASAQQSPVFGATNAHQKTDTLLALVKEASEIMDITYAGNFPAGIESFLVRASHVLQGREQE